MTGLPGDTDLPRLLGALEPVARARPVAVLDRVVPGLRLLALVEEDEGTTTVVDAAAARDAGVAVAEEFAWITLRVASSLLAVGLLAAVATRLAAAGIPCNPLAGVHHDHVLVPEVHREAALAGLRALQGEHAG